MVSDAPPTDAPRAVDGPHRILMRCDDGVYLGGDLWAPTTGPLIGQVVVNCATGVLSRYYHRYARFLASYGFVVLTYDYRGIGLSRPERLRGCGYRWRDWGQKDFEAALATMVQAHGALPLAVVGHSVGGFLPGLAKGASRIDRMLTVGAQYAWLGDYASTGRRRLLWKWHVVMPALAAVCGYFPGRRLGWLEDLPKGVALEWAFRRASFERNHPVAERERVLAGMKAVRAHQALRNPREALKIQMIFQDPQSSLNARLKVVDIVGEAPVVHGLVARRDKVAYVRDILAKVGLPPEALQRYPHQFSGGQRQRIGIARALAVQPEILICDESVAALDVSVQAQIINLLMDIRRTLGLTMVFISHDLGIIRHLCDRVVVMYLGRIVETAPTDELFARPVHPYTRMLLAGMPQISLERRRFMTIQGEIPSPVAPPKGCHFHPRCPNVKDECIATRPLLETVADRRSAACIRWRDIGLE